MNIDIKDKINNLMGNRKTLGIIKQDLSERFSTLDKSLALFHRIYGNNNLKENIYRSLISSNQVNILLIGPPATCKTLFMQIIQESCNDVIYFDATNTSGAGLIEVLYRNQNAKVLIIDEIDKLKKNDLSCLLGLLNNGSVDKALKTIHYKFTMHVKIFATSNSSTKLSKPVRSRFQEYILPEYSDDEYVNVVKFCLDKLPAETSEIIAKVLLSHEKKDVRTALSIASLIQQNDSMDDIARVIENYIKYSSQEATDYN
jgi:replication-associated recombination protein RarA